MGPPPGTVFKTEEGPALNPGRTEIPQWWMILFFMPWYCKLDSGLHVDSMFCIFIFILILFGRFVIGLSCTMSCDVCAKIGGGLGGFCGCHLIQVPIKYMPHSPIHTHSYTDGRGCHGRLQLLIRSNVRHFNMQLLGAGIRNNNLPITRGPALLSYSRPLSLYLVIFIWSDSLTVSVLCRIVSNNIY